MMHITGMDVGFHCRAPWSPDDLRGCGEMKSNEIGSQKGVVAGSTRSLEHIIIPSCLRLQGENLC